MSGTPIEGHVMQGISESDGQVSSSIQRYTPGTDRPIRAARTLVGISDAQVPTESHQALRQPGSWVVGHTHLFPDARSITNGLLYSYNRSVGIYRCPSDRKPVADGENRWVRHFSYGINGYLNGVINDKRMQEYEFEGNRYGVTKFAGIRWPADTLLFGAAFEGNRLHDPTDSTSPAVKNITVKSVRGPWETIIRMAESPADPW